MTTQSDPTIKEPEWTGWNRYHWTQEIINDYLKSPKSSIKPWAKHAKVINNQFISIGSRIVVPIEMVENTIKREYEDTKTGYVGRDKLFERIFAKYIGISRRAITSVLYRLDPQFSNSTAANDQSDQTHRCPE